MISGEINEKRCYLLDGIKYKYTCPTCKADQEDETCGDNISYPSVNKWIGLSSFCEKCEDYVDAQMRINITVDFK